MNQNSLHAFWAAVLMEFLLGCTAASNQSSEVIYRGDGANRIEVFNVAELAMYSALPAYVSSRKKRFILGEFGGTIRYCSDENFLCLEGGINIAVPKLASGQMEWSFKGRSCSSRIPFGEAWPNEVSCRFNSYVTEFVFDGSRGVIAYRWHRDPPNEYGAGPESNFKLIGNRGLFADSVHRK